MPIRFRCPKCQALMQVAEEAAGHHTECPGCQSVCEVPRKSTDPGPPADRNVADRNVADRNVADRNVAAASPSVPAAGRPIRANQPTARAFKQPVEQAADTSIIQLRCPSCQQLMRATKGAMVKCPHCSSTVKAPGGTSSADPGTSGQRFSLGQSSPAGLDSDWNALPNSSVRPSQSLPSQAGPYSTNPYGGAIGGGYRTAQPGDRSWQYVLLGIIFVIASLPAFLGTLWNIIKAVMTLTGVGGNIPPEQTALLVGGAIGSVFISLPLATMYLIGGIAFLRRQPLSAAQIVSVVACIPCLNYLILTPFGIWAAIIIFSEQARKDFDN